MRWRATGNVEFFLCVPCARCGRKQMSVIQSDFDRLAPFSRDGWDHNSHYHDFLLRHLPARCANALDVGCGTGMFSRHLAARADHVLALDLSPQMIRLARERSAWYPNIEFQVGDVLAYDFPDAHFDCVASIATLHHLPFEVMLQKLARTLKPNGVLLALDLFKAKGLVDKGIAAFGLPANFALRLIKLHRLREPAEVRAAWAEHGKHEVYPTLAQIHETCAHVIPGAQVTRHLLWRYSIVWRKPDSA